MENEQRLTPEEVDQIVASFLQHIADNWETYKDNLPGLRRTMMFYNEFASGIRYLPENSIPVDERDLYFNPKDPLIDDLPKFFGERYTEEIENLVYGAWPLRAEGRPWLGYQEPIDDTPEALMKAWPTLYPTLEKAREGFFNNFGTGRDWFEGQMVHMTAGGYPDIWYRGFTTMEEFPEQRQFLDTIRNHTRIQVGISLMEQEAAKAKEKHSREEAWQLAFKKASKILAEYHTASEERKVEIDGFIQRILEDPIN